MRNVIWAAVGAAVMAAALAGGAHVRAAEDAGLFAAGQCWYVAPAFADPAIGDRHREFAVLDVRGVWVKTGYGWLNTAQVGIVGALPTTGAVCVELQRLAH